jgi:hypothetical protein
MRKAQCSRNFVDSQQQDCVKEGKMAVADKLPKALQDALDQGALNRLPMTFLPFVNQQLHQWEHLFPKERQSVERLLLYVESLSPEESSALFRNVSELEMKMGVKNWRFSTSEQTIQNSSRLARSPYFQEWRRAVQAVFDTADRHAAGSEGITDTTVKRLVLLDLPHNLPLNAATAWSRWQGIGKSLKLDLGTVKTSPRPFDILLSGTKGEGGASSGGLLDAVQNRAQGSAADTWVVDAERSLVDAILRGKHPDTNANAILLSYARLDAYRQNFSHEMNTMRKDLADADAVFDRLRKVDVMPWCPAEVASDPAVREFVRSLYLAGNGAVIFGNSFVEWAASEAFRRARPILLAAKFGVRSKPKPFTGVAVFENPDQVNPLPAVDDLEGSAIDAQMLALYVWLAAGRYEEYRHKTVCVCVAESLSEAYIVAPPEFDSFEQTQPVTIDRLGRALRNWIA